MYRFLCAFVGIVLTDGRLAVAAEREVGTKTVTGRTDQISVLVPAFGGGPVGKNVATVLNLKLWRTLRPTPHNSQHYYPGGQVLWSVEPLASNSYEEAERAAKVNNAQLALWGSAVEFGNGVLVQCFLSIPEYEDLRREQPEKWLVTLACRDSTKIQLEVTVPRRRYEFSPITLDSELVATYSIPSALKLYRTADNKTPVGDLGNSYTAIQHDGDYTKVVSDNKQTGWVYVPKLSSEIEIVNFTGGLVRLLRADYPGAIELLKKISDSRAGTSLKFDALLLQAIAKAKQGEDPNPVVDVAIALNPHLQAGIKFKITSLLWKYVTSSESQREQVSTAKELKRVISDNSYLFSTDDKWMLAARKALDCILEQSAVDQR